MEDIPVSYSKLVPSNSRALAEGVWSFLQPQLQDLQLLEMEIPEEGAQAQHPQEEGQGKENAQSKREAPTKIGKEGGPAS